MRDFDQEPVVKAETDAEILGALQGAMMAQQCLQKAAQDDEQSASMSLAFFRGYFEKLPDSVARRMTEIDLEAVERIPTATAMYLTGPSLRRLADKVASPAAFAQVIRAANIYRVRLGHGPLGPDGWPETQGGVNDGN